MFSFFSRSRSRNRYPKPDRGGSYYRRNGLFRSGSFSRSGREYRGYGQQPTPPQGAPAYSSPSNQATGMFCSHCGVSVPAGSKFCLSCGAPMRSAAYCPRCGKSVPAEAKFCPDCGAPVR